MIKIEIPDIAKKAQEHCDKVKPYAEAVIDRQIAFLEAIPKALTKTQDVETELYSTSALNLKFAPVFFGIKTPFYGLD
jgi:hypothetical protein